MGDLYCRECAELTSGTCWRHQVAVVYSHSTVPDPVLELHSLRAECARLREERDSQYRVAEKNHDREVSATRRAEKAEADLAEALSALEWWVRNYEAEEGCACDRCKAIPGTRALLSRLRPSTPEGAK